MVSDERRRGPRFKEAKKQRSKEAEKQELHENPNGRTKDVFWTSQPVSDVKGKMAKTFKRGDHVKWNSEAAIISGRIVRKVTSDAKIKGYVYHASKDAPQYMIKSDKTDHVAIHKGAALHRLKKTKRNGAKRVRRRGLRR